MTPATLALVADTQVVIWYVLEASGCPDKAREALKAAVEAQQPIRVNA